MYFSISHKLTDFGGIYHFIYLYLVLTNDFLGFTVLHADNISFLKLLYRNDVIKILECIFTSHEWQLLYCGHNIDALMFEIENVFWNWNENDRVGTPN